MRSMADLYSNRELACVREYSTNARDAMVEAGKGHLPIEVTLPNGVISNPVFIVKDRGVGMNSAELKETYTQFGESTKRDSDDYNGMLGFGSKSAVAYTNTFTITSVKDGLKNVAVITRSEDAMGGYIISMKLVIRDLPTTEENGTEVQIPVHNYQEFARKAQDFFRFWEPGTVLVNGQQPEWFVGDKLTDNLYLTPSGTQSYVVMGYVAYPVVNSDYLFPAGMKRMPFVAFVENGTVEFTPNREALKYSDHTKNNLRKIITDFCDSAVDKAKEEIAAAKTHFEAYDAWTRWTNIVGTQNVPALYFKGEKLAHYFEVNGQRWERGRTRYSTQRINNWAINSVNNAIFVTDFVSNLNSDHKAKARQWAELKGLDFRFVIFTQDKIKSPWVDPKRVVRWEDLKAALPKAPKAPRAQSTAPGRKAGTFDLITRSGRELEQDVPATKKLYYCMVQDYKRSNNGYEFPYILNQFNFDHKIVLLPANRKDKFLRHYPHAKPIWPMLESMVKLDGKQLLSADALAYFDITTQDAQRLRMLDKDKVNDPELKKAIAICNKPETEYTKEYNRHERLARVLGIYSKFVTYPKVRGTWDRKVTPLKGYKLLAAHLSSDQLDHVYVYLNAVYAARKAGKIV